MFYLPIEFQLARVNNENHLKLAEMDRSAKFREHIEPQAPRLYASALRLCGDKSEAEDLLQETLIKAYKNLHRFRDGSDAGAWTYVILRNTFYNEVRSRKRREPLLSDGEAAERIPYNDAFFSEGGVDDRMQRALDSLPDGIRETVVAREIMGMDYEQISEALGVPLGTVKSRIKRGREKLRTLWKKSGWK